MGDDRRQIDPLATFALSALQEGAMRVRAKDLTTFLVLGQGEQRQLVLVDGSTPDVSLEAARARVGEAKAEVDLYAIGYLARVDGTEHGFEFCATRDLPGELGRGRHVALVIEAGHRTQPIGRSMGVKLAAAENGLIVDGGPSYYQATPNWFIGAVDRQR